MSKLLNILGFDPSGSNWGIAAATYDITSGQLNVARLHVISPELSTSKTVRQSSKDIERAICLLREAKKWSTYADVICAEVPHGSQSARAALLAGMCHGVLASFVMGSVPVIQVNAGETRTVITGKPKATKLQAIEWAMAKHPEAPWPMKTVKGITTVVEGTAEHMADAIAAIYASTKTETFKALVQARKGLIK